MNDSVDIPRPKIDMQRLYDYRLARLRQQMLIAEVDLMVLVNPVSLRYAADYRNYALFQSHIPTFYLIVSIEGPLILYGGYAPTQTISQVRKASFLSCFDGGLDLLDNARGFVRQIQGVLSDLGLTRKRIACERLNPSALITLKSFGFEVLDAEPLVEQARYIKSDDELCCMRYSIKIAQLGMEKIQQALVPGITENQLWSILHQVNIAYDGDWIDGRMLCSGSRTNPWLQEATDKVIKQGELVGLDTDMIGPFGYCADISRTFLCGDKPASAKQRDRYQRAYAEIRHNIELITVGMNYHELSERAYHQQDEFIARRYPCLAHGVGMSDEYPKIYYPQDWQAHGYDGVIEANTVMSIESYVGSEYGGEGVKLEEMILIRSDGIELLSSFEFDERLL